MGENELRCGATSASSSTPKNIIALLSPNLTEISTLDPSNELSDSRGEKLSCITGINNESQGFSSDLSCGPTYKAPGLFSCVTTMTAGQNLSANVGKAWKDLTEEMSYVAKHPSTDTSELAFAFCGRLTNLVDSNGNNVRYNPRLCAASDGRGWAIASDDTLVVSLKAPNVPNVFNITSEATAAVACGTNLAAPSTSVNTAILQSPNMTKDTTLEPSSEVWDSQGNTQDCIVSDNNKSESFCSNFVCTKGDQYTQCNTTMKAGTHASADVGMAWKDLTEEMSYVAKHPSTDTSELAFAFCGRLTNLVDSEGHKIRDDDIPKLCLARNGLHGWAIASDKIDVSCIDLNTFYFDYLPTPSPSPTPAPSPAPTPTPSPSPTPLPSPTPSATKYGWWGGLTKGQKYLYIALGVLIISLLFAALSSL